MKWVWQLPDFPNFIYNPEVIADEEAVYLKNSGKILGEDL
mgnify:CR=1 FL=1